MESKNFVKSMTLQGLFIMIMAPLLAKWLNIPLENLTAADLENTVALVLEAVGAIMAFIGRIRAKTTLKAV